MFSSRLKFWLGLLHHLKVQENLDQQRFSEIYRATLPDISRFIARRCPPADVEDIIRALTATQDERPAPPENPMSADRVRWEHIQRVYEREFHVRSFSVRRLVEPFM